MRDKLNFQSATLTDKSPSEQEAINVSEWLPKIEDLKDENTVVSSKPEIEAYLHDIEEKYGVKLVNTQPKLSDIKDRLDQLERTLHEKSQDVKQLRQLTEENKQLVDHCGSLSSFLHGIGKEEEVEAKEETVIKRNNQLSRANKKNSVRLSRIDLDLHKIFIDNEKRCKALIVGDSHARNMQSLLEEQLGEDYSISCTFKPNATLREMLQDIDRLTVNYTEHDFVAILGGVNGINDLCPIAEDILDVCQTLRKFSDRINVIMNEIPYRYDLREMNYYIRVANSILDEYISKKYQSRSFKMVSVKFKKSVHYTKHGLNLNATGKRHFATQLANMIRDVHQL